MRLVAHVNVLQSLAPSGRIAYWVVPRVETLG
jgi:hypothetical protein